jgi:signal transduction histidine kinase
MARLTASAPMAGSTPTPPWRRLFFKLLGGTLLPTVLALGSFAVLAHEVAQHLLEEELGKRLATAATGVATAILPEQVEAMADGDPGSLTFANVSRRLVTGVRRFDVRRAAIITPSGEARGDSEGQVALGRHAYETDADRREIARALAGQPAASVLFRGHDGRLYKRAYAPIARPNEAPVALAMVEGSASSFAELALLRRRMGLTTAVALALLLGVTALLSRRITGPVERLAEAADRIGRGDLAAPVPRETRDEIGALARTLDEMRAALAARDERMQMMLAGIAHEVRNPLGGISLFAGLLRDALAHEPARLEELARIEKEVRHLEAIVSEFLAYARRPPLARQELLLRPLLDEVAEHIAADHVTVTVRAPSGLTVGADEHQLRRSLLNLGKNAAAAACKKHPEGGGRVVLAAEEDADCLILRVADNGEGVAAELRAQIFAPFFTTKEQGTGLGLAFVKDTAEAHGGSIALLQGGAGSRDPEGLGGAIFELRLPKWVPSQQDGRS